MEKTHTARQTLDVATEQSRHRAAGPGLTSYRVRRDRELSSLYATARSLTVLGEVDTVLESIVREAHELIGTDFTYLSLLGEDGSLTLKASQGTISSSFSTARVPSGTGVGGRVIATGAPAWVSNYLAARDVPHDEYFDDLVLPEGMVALLGVPLLISDEVIGVLFAADRTERPFEHDEVALLSAFADHAAIALSNARLYEESRSALRRLQEAYATIEGQVEVMERVQLIHESLTHVVLKGGGSREVAQLLVDQLLGAVTVYDGAGSVTAMCAYEGLASPLERPSPDPVEQARHSGRWATTTDSSGLWHSAAAIQAGDTHLGAVLLTRSDEPGALDVRALERAAQILGLLILKESAVAEAEERVRGELLSELIMSTGPAGSSERARAQARGVDIEALDVVVVAESTVRTGPDVGRRLHALSRDLGGLGGEHLGRATMLAGSSDVGQLARTVQARLRRDLGVPVRVVAERVHDEDWGRAFERASRCCDLMGSLGVHDRAATADQYAMLALLFDPDRAGDLARFMSETIGSLVQYDERRSTELVLTLTRYFDQAGHLTRTAEALHVHPNTLLKRLDRVGTILGAGWRDPERVLPLQVALRLHKLRNPTETSD